MSKLSGMRIVLLLTTIALATATFAQQKPAGSLEADLASVSPVIVAGLLSGNGLSAGMVLRLPDSLNEALDRARRRRDVFEGDRHAFGVLVSNTRFPGPLAALPPATTAVDVLNAFVQANSAQGWQNRPGRPGRVSVLREPSAGVCEAALRQKVSSDHHGVDLADLVSRLVYDATGADVPNGAVGACAGGRRPVGDPLYVEGGQSLEDALGAVAAGFEGTVWVAVETSTSECALGLVTRRDASLGACQVAITGHMGRPPAR